MQPQSQPKSLITLVSASSSTLYSGFIPSHLSGELPLADTSINVRSLADRAGVHFIQANAESIDLSNKLLLLSNRPAIAFDVLSLNLGAVSPRGHFKTAIPVKPLGPALKALNQQDQLVNRDQAAFHVAGAGLAAIEVIFALRLRWPHRPLVLHCGDHQLDARLVNALTAIGVILTEAPAPDGTNTLLCTGSEAPNWLQAIGLGCDPRGRVLTHATLQGLDHPWLFASGDCASIQGQPRPASGVYAVRAAPILASNLKRLIEGQPLKTWTPQKRALQLLGTHTPNQRAIAWAKIGSLLIGPNPWLWRWKQHLDRRFIQSFQQLTTPANEMNRQGEAASSMACRGCAAKLGASPLKQALALAGVAGLGSDPADAQVIGCNSERSTLLTSVDGFPALISDPWLNGRITTLHACSDLWASGAHVTAVQAIVTVPAIDDNHQVELLSQTLAGVRSALNEQGADLIGGHTMESRQPSATPSALDLQLSLSVTGQTPSGAKPWCKGPIQPGDVLLLSRGLGSGVMFAAAMQGRCKPWHLDACLQQLGSSQHTQLDELMKLQAEAPGCIHACTDITGFGLLGHLNEMLAASPAQTVDLWIETIPSFNGALDLLKAGLASTLAPSNGRALASLGSRVRAIQHSEDVSDKLEPGFAALLIDPQTCGPLLVSCDSATAHILEDQGWIAIGQA